MTFLERERRIRYIKNALIALFFLFVLFVYYDGIKKNNSKMQVETSIEKMSINDIALTLLNENLRNTLYWSESVTRHSGTDEMEFAIEELEYCISEGEDYFGAIKKDLEKKGSGDYYVGGNVLSSLNELSEALERIQKLLKERKAKD